MSDRASADNNDLHEKITALEQRIEKLERRLPPPLRVEPVFVPQRPEPAAQAEPAPFAQPKVEPAPFFKSLPPRPPPDPDTLERTIGLKWTAWVGAVVFVLGVLFFLKYAWDQGWINPTPTMRVVAAIITGAILSAIGERMHFRKLQALAATLHGAGLAIVLASFFGAYALFEPAERVLGVTGAFSGVVITAGAGVLIALHIRSVIVVVIAMVGAYIAPFILNTGADRSLELLTYVAVLSAVAWVVSYLKPRWEIVRLLAWIGTMGTFVAWWFGHGQENGHTNLATAFLALYHVGFLAESILTLRKADPDGPRTRLDAACALILLLNTAATFAMLRVIYRDASYGIYLGAVAIVMAMMQAGAAFLTRARAFSVSSLLQATALLTLAVPLIFESFAISMAWLALAVVVAALAWEMNLPAARGWAVILLILSIVRLLAFDWRLQRNIVVDTPFFTASQWVLMAWGTAMLTHLIAWLRPGTRDRFPVFRSRLAEILPQPAPLALRIPDAVLQYAQPARTGDDDTLDVAGVLIALIGTGLFFGTSAAEYSGSTLTLVCLLWTVGIISLVHLARALGYIAHATIFLALLTLKWCALDALTPIIEHWSRPDVSALLPPFMNMVVLNGLLLCVAIVGLLAQLRRLEPLSVQQQHGLAVWISLLLLAMLNFEAIRVVDWIATHGGSIRDPGVVKHGVMSVLWALVGFAGVTIGFWKKVLPLRIAALVLLGVTLLKIMVIDMAEVKAIWRILSFVAVGGLLLGVSYVYHQHMSERKGPA